MIKLWDLHHVAKRNLSYVILSSFNQNWNVSKRFNKRNSVQRFSSCYMMTDGQTDKYGEANRQVFSMFHSHVASTGSINQKFWQYNTNDVFSEDERSEKGCFALHLRQLLCRCYKAGWYHTGVYTCYVTYLDITVIKYEY